MSHFNSRSSLDVYYPDNSYNIYNIENENNFYQQDKMGNCNGLCTYDNIGLNRPAFTRVPLTTPQNIWNKYIWVEKNKKAILYLTISDKQINGYLKFNENQNYPIMGIILEENKKARLSVRYPKIGIMDNNVMAELKQLKANRFLLHLKFSQYSNMTFYNSKEKIANNANEQPVKSSVSLSQVTESVSPTVKHRVVYLSINPDKFTMFLSFDASFINDNKVFISYDTPKDILNTGVNVKKLPILKRGKYNINRQLPIKWIFEPYNNDENQYLICSFTTNRNVPKYYIECNENGGVNITNIPGSEKQIWTLISDSEDKNAVNIKSVYFGWYLGYSTSPSILKNTLLVNMSNKPIKWSLHYSTKYLINPETLQQLIGYYTSIYTDITKFNIEYNIGISLTKNKKICISIPKLNKNGSFIGKRYFNLKLDKDPHSSSQLIGKNANSIIKIDIRKNNKQQMEIKVIENDNIISQTKYWNGTTISNISEYSTKIPGLPDNNDSGCDRNLIESFNTVIEHQTNMEPDTNPLRQCPAKYPFAYGTKEAGSGTKCCIGNPGKEDPNNKDEVYECRKDGCFGEGCGNIDVPCDASDPTAICVNNSNTLEKSTCPASHPYPYDGWLEADGKLYGKGKDEKNYFCCKTEVDPNSDSCPNGEWVTCPFPPCYPVIEVNIDPDKAKLVNCCQEITHVQKINGVWKLMTKENDIGGINIDKKNVGVFIDTTRYIQKAKYVCMSNEPVDKKRSSAQAVLSATEDDDNFYINTNINPGGIKIPLIYRNKFNLRGKTLLYLTPSNIDVAPCASRRDTIDISTSKNCYVNPESRVAINITRNGNKVEQNEKNKSTIQDICQANGGCYDDSDPNAPWCYQRGTMCSSNDDCTEGGQCYIDPVCTTWNNIQWNLDCQDPKNEGVYSKNCNMIYQCKDGNAELIMDRPAVGDQSAFPNANLPYATDYALYSETHDLQDMNNNIIDKCYPYGLDYSNANPPYACWGAENTGNFKVLNNLGFKSNKKGMCINKSFIYGLINNLAYRYNMVPVIKENVWEKLPNNSNDRLIKSMIINNSGDKLYAIGRDMDGIYRIIYSYDLKQGGPWNEVVKYSQNLNKILFNMKGNILYVLTNSGNIEKYSIENGGGSKIGNELVSDYKIKAMELSYNGNGLYLLTNENQLICKNLKKNIIIPLSNKEAYQFKNTIILGPDGKKLYFIVNQGIMSIDVTLQIPESNTFFSNFRLFYSNNDISSISTNKSTTELIVTENGNTYTIGIIDKKKKNLNFNGKNEEYNIELIPNNPPSPFVIYDKKYYFKEGNQLHRVENPAISNEIIIYNENSKLRAKEINKNEFSKYNVTNIVFNKEMIGIN